MNMDKGFKEYERYRPISAWGYVGYTILFSIPVIGWLFLIVYTFSRKNLVRRSYARSYWCWLLIAVVSVLVFVLVRAFDDQGTSRIRNYRAIYEDIAGKIGIGNEYDSADKDVMKDNTGITGSSNADKTASPSASEKATAAPAKKATPTATVTPTATSTITPTAKPTETAKKNNVLSPEFKKMVDSYEVFFDEYIAFMVKYSASNNEIGMLKDYLSFMSRYTDAMEAMEALGDSEMNDAEERYYTEVNLRILGKLSNAALLMSY